MTELDSATEIGRRSDLGQGRPRADGTGNRGLPRYIGYVLAFVAGSVIVVAGRYALHGTAVELTPEAFLSLVFTVAVGAASLLLAILAINYGRVSEKVMTERADRSIDIQMDLFQKSLGLQTQLFDKTMSTLESIGRSTGVTEQRLSDIHSLMQNPTTLRQIAGRAVEQTTSELVKGGKEVQKQEQVEPAMAERLTKNIVRELSARFEALAGPGEAHLTRPRPASELQSTESRLRRSVEDLQRSEALGRKKQELRTAIEKAVAAIPGAQLKHSASVYWDFVVSLGDKKLAVDMRTSRGSRSGDISTYESSIVGLVKDHGADSLIFVFLEPPLTIVTEYFSIVNEAFPDKVSFVVTVDAKILESAFKRILGTPPAASVHPIRQGPA